MDLYGLRSSDGEGIRYIGETSQKLNDRLNAHLNGARSGRDDSVKSEWILAEEAAGRTIEIVLLAHNSRPHTDEQRLIDAFRLVRGSKLLNTLAGEWQSCRVKAGLARAKANGIISGRPKMAPEKTKEIADMLATGLSINKTAKALGVGVGTVHRVKVEAHLEMERAGLPSQTAIPDHLILHPVSEYRIQTVQSRQRQ